MYEPMKHLVALQLVLLCAGASQLAHAQSWPAKPVRMIINVAPGGGSDILARKLSPPLGQQLGQLVLVDNRPGAAGVLGTSTAAAAAPDGYTLTMISSSHASNAPMHKSLPYHPVDSFSPVILFALSPQVLLTRPNAPFRNVRELIAHSKSNQGKLNMGSSGTGSTPHLSGELLRMMSGISFTHIPYKGGGPAMADLMGGQLDLLFVVTQTAMPQVAAGKVRPLAVASATRLAAFPDVPTIAESGVPGYEASNWAGVLAPAKTPGPVVQVIHDAMIRTIRAKENRDWMVEQGLIPAETGPSEFRALLQAEIAKWTKVVAASGIIPE
jgi:tripartite-type tricarboxylate transporter receptor subunit TctC